MTNPGLAAFQFPPPTTDPIPFIEPPTSDGIRCDAEGCQYVFGTIQRVQQHCRRAHGWTNERKRGGDVARRVKQARDLTWTAGVQCQQFFKSRAASGWFEVVDRSTGPATAAAGEAEDPMEL